MQLLKLRWFFQQFITLTYHELGHLDLPVAANLEVILPFWKREVRKSFLYS